MSVSNVYGNGVAHNVANYAGSTGLRADAPQVPTDLHVERVHVATAAPPLILAQQSVGPWVTDSSASAWYGGLDGDSTTSSRNSRTFTSSAKRSMVFLYSRSRFGERDNRSIRPPPLG